MAIKVHFQTGNGALKITVGSDQTSAGDDGGSSPGNPTNNSGGGPGGGPGCGGLVVIGPIVVDGSSLQSGAQGQSGQGGSSPGNPTNNSGGGGPRTALGGSSPGNPTNNSGGGGPVSSGVFSGLTVIGPIVIGGASQGSSASAVSNDAQEISLSPPAGVRTTGRAPSFQMQEQDETDWCWAASAVSINAYLDPPLAAAPATWTQELLATRVLAQELQWDPPVDCTRDPAQQCDQPAGLDDALAITGNLMQGGALFNQFLDFASIASWIDQQLPLGARILWPEGGAHFIVLSGYVLFATGEQKVIVQDPLYGPSIQDYGSLRGWYLYQGMWNDTYLVTP